MRRARSRAILAPRWWRTIPPSCFAWVAWVVVGAGGTGCGAISVDEFPNRLIGAEGQRITVEDIEVISSDPSLSDGEKAQRFRDLGLQDEKLIRALLDL